MLSTEAGEAYNLAGVPGAGLAVECGVARYARTIVIEEAVIAWAG